jgi:translation initiation factor 2B subunit (eIF-2B alpha/beta/delta family)
MVVLSALLISGCAGNRKAATDQPKEKIVVQATDADTILSCLSGEQKMSRQAFNGAYKTAFANAARDENGEVLRLICLSLHQYASYKQFKDGMDALSLYIKAHPESASVLQGIHILMQRIDREKIGKWALSNKSLDEKDGLEAENKELLERNEVLEKGASNDQARIKELQKQIEQLKNIESIIKNRER